MILLWGKEKKNGKDRSELQRHYEREQNKKEGDETNVIEEIRMKRIRRVEELKRKSSVVEEEMIVKWKSCFFGNF